MRSSLSTVEIRVEKPASRAPFVALAASLAILAAEILGIVRGLGLLFGR
jgi:hypothetical protein